MFLVRDVCRRQMGRHAQFSSHATFAQPRSKLVTWWSLRFGPTKCVAFKFKACEVRLKVTQLRMNSSGVTSAGLR